MPATQNTKYQYPNIHLKKKKNNKKKSTVQDIKTLPSRFWADRVLVQVCVNHMKMWAADWSIQHLKRFVFFSYFF